MKSNKQRRAELDAKRAARADKARLVAYPPAFDPERDRPVNAAAFAPFNSYGEPEFLCRGYYRDQAFTCIDCGADEVWTAAQQKWWHEVAKGYVYAAACRCRPCRRKRKDGGRPSDHAAGSSVTRSGSDAGRAGSPPQE